MNQLALAGVIGAVLLQFLVLTGMYVKAATPLWTGEEIRVKTTPIDPRSLFRGNYAKLRYDFNRIARRYFSGNDTLRNGEIVYVSLKKGPQQTFEFAAASLEQPVDVDTVFLRGRVTGTTEVENEKYYTINYGIDAFFAPQNEALLLEQELRDGGVAILMV
ncbi:MAG: GDYXXLXY domain-containing protein, partial [Endozoicomonas sp.]|uniref:GDYXXLXY domain-containing protein n=1 Tax=Endozoicomonas sp. TaxID=1892382 RepID=UPI003D9B4E42